MPILRIEHDVPNYDGWKKAFDNDPIDRKKSGVTSYRIYQPVDQPGVVIVDLEFEKMDELESTLLALQRLWNKVQGTVIMSPTTRVLEVREARSVQVP